MAKSVTTLYILNQQRLHQKILYKLLQLHPELADLEKELTKTIPINPLLKEERKKEICELITNIVSSYYKISIHDLLKPARSPGAKKGTTMEARRVLMYLLKTYIPSASLGYIGKFIGNRDHSTVINGVEMVEALLEVEKPIRADINELRKIIDNLLSTKE